MELFDYLMAKKGHNTSARGDLFSYLLGKKASGGSGTYTTFSGTSLNISNTIKAAIKKFMLNSTELTQDETPTPDNPVDVNVITGSNNIKITDGTEEQNYPITLSSKNLFNINGDVNTRYNGQTGNYNTVIGNDLTSTYTNNDGYPYGQRIYVGVGKTVTISAKVKSFVPSNRVGSVGRILVFNDNTSSGVSYVTYNNDETEIKTLTFTPTTDYIYVAFSFAAPTSQQSSVTFTDIQVEYGESATPYIPYIINPLEYCKIGDYADQIFKNTTNSPYYDNTLIENEWYLKKNINKVTFDGSDDEVYEKAYGSIYNNKCMFYLKNIPHNNSNYELMKSNRFSPTQGASEYYPEGINVTYRSNDLVLNMSADRLAEYSIPALKTFFQNNNTDVYLVTETPTYIHITETDYPILRSQLENLYNNAKSYNGQTNITQTNDGLPFNISVNVKVLDTNLNMSNSLNSSLLSNNLQNEEETSLGNTNEIDEIEEPIEEYEEL